MKTALLTAILALALVWSGVLAAEVAKAPATAVAKLPSPAEAIEARASYLGRPGARRKSRCSA